MSKPIGYTRHVSKSPEDDDEVEADSSDDDGGNDIENIEGGESCHARIVYNMAYKSVKIS